MQLLHQLLLSQIIYPDNLLCLQSKSNLFLHFYNMDMNYCHIMVLHSHERMTPLWIVRWTSQLETNAVNE
jgi:hypothetical protein